MSKHKTYFADLTWGDSKATVSDDRPDAFAHNLAKQVESMVRHDRAGDLEIRVSVTTDGND